MGAVHIVICRPQIIPGIKIDIGINLVEHLGNGISVSCNRSVGIPYRKGRTDLRQFLMTIVILLSSPGSVRICPDISVSLSNRLRVQHKPLCTKRIGLDIQSPGLLIIRHLSDDRSLVSHSPDIMRREPMVRTEQLLRSQGQRVTLIQPDAPVIEVI